MEFTKSNVAGLVVLFEPDQQVLEKINRYLFQVDFLFVVDNTESLKKDFVKHALIGQQNIKYIANGKNLGIANALNVGANLALEAGYQWLLTMDQDSCVPAQMVGNLLDAINNYPNLDQIGIMSPAHMLIDGQIDTSIRDLLKKNKEIVVEAVTVMTSGNLLNLKVYSTVGPFIDKLFIDYVDVEYCLRLNKKGYKVLVASNIILEHSLGNISVHKYKVYPKHQFTLLNHNYIRKYYITRNRLFVQNLYKKDFPSFCQHDFKCQIKEIIKTSMLENNRFKKIKYFSLGVYHYSLNRYGKL